MKLDRAEFLAALAVVKPALAAGGIIPTFSHVWFDKKHIYACDGGLGIKLKFATALACGLPGAALTGVLATSALKQIELDETDTAVELILGRSKVQLVSLPSDQQDWRFPAVPPKKAGTVELSEEFLEGLRKIMFVRAARATQVFHHGVTLVTYKKEVCLYSTDSRTLATVAVKAKAVGVENVLLPRAFLEQVLARAEPGAVLYVTDDCLMVEAGDVCLYSNMLDNTEAPDMEQLVSKNMPDAKVEPVELPGGLLPALSRAEVLSGSDESLVSLTVKGDSLKVSGKFALGALQESLQLKGDHPEVSASFEAAMISRGMIHADRLYVGPRACVLFGPDEFVYIVGSRPGTKTEAPEKGGRSKRG